MRTKHKAGNTNPSVRYSDSVGASSRVAKARAKALVVQPVAVVAARPAGVTVKPTTNVAVGRSTSMTRQEEAKLIAQAAAGDARAAETFIKAHQQSLFAYILRLSGRPDVAEDIVQEAFVRVLTNLHRFDSRFRFSTWLFTIARRLYVNACQKHKPSYDTDVVGACSGKTARPETGVIRSETNGLAKDALQKALLQLSVQQREIIVLFHQLDWPISLIAQHVGMPEGTVKSHLHRGRKALRRLLDGEGGVGGPDEHDVEITSLGHVSAEVNG